MVESTAVTGGCNVVQATLGIDVGKTDFHCALIAGDEVGVKHFPNSSTGFSQLRRWLRNRNVERVHACLESTGGWSEELATDLHEHGHAVSIVNPLAVRPSARANFLARRPIRLMRR